MDVGVWIINVQFFYWRVGGQKYINEVHNKCDLFMATRFQVTEALGFTMRCTSKSLSMELLAKHTIRIKRSLLMEKKKHRVNTLLADKSLFWEA